MTEISAPDPVCAATPSGDYYVLDAKDTIVHASAGCVWMRRYLGHVVWECMPLAEIIFRPRFEEARRAAREVEFNVFYAGALSRIKAVPAGSDLTVFVTHLENLNVRTLATLTTSLRRIEAELAGRASEQLDSPAHASPQALP
jgi:hypothetical protein